MEKTKKGFIAIAFDEGSTGSTHARVGSGSGETPKEAATWLVRHLAQLATQAQQLTVELGLLTSEEATTATQPQEGTPS